MTVCVRWTLLLHRQFMYAGLARASQTSTKKERNGHCAQLLKQIQSGVLNPWTANHSMIFELRDCDLAVRQALVDRSNLTLRQLIDEGGMLMHFGELYLSCDSPHPESERWHPGFRNVDFNVSHNRTQLT